MALSRNSAIVISHSDLHGRTRQVMLHKTRRELRLLAYTRTCRDAYVCSPYRSGPNQERR